MTGWQFELHGDYERSHSLEWLETNGLGGYASSTACGANSRRYHGLLVAATRPPVGRVVLLSKLDERVIVGGASYDLSTNQFPGAVHPQGFQHLLSFTRDLFPVFEYEAGGALLRKTIAAVQGENTTIVLYELLAGEMTLELRPFLAARDYHALAKANHFARREGAFEGEVYAHTMYDTMPALFLSMPGFTFEAQPDWWRNFEYPKEQERGLEAHEDLFTPGVFRRRVAGAARVAIIASTEVPRGRDGIELFDAERQRRQQLVRNAGIRGQLGRALILAADQFIVPRGSNRSVIAGYHWFTDWGRDTMISLPGLCLATKRFEDAQLILHAYAESVSEGMLPNRFPDHGEPPEYNTVDATLWFFVAAQKYWDQTADVTFLRETLLPVLRDIVAWHDRGTRHGIRVDADGLLTAGRPGDQLTWMDAKVGGEPVTSRYGKPVEVNALWYNALRILSGFERRSGSPDSARDLAARADAVAEQFRRVFWNEDAGCLYDVIRPEGPDASIRPNQIFALTLPFPLLEEPQASSVLKVVEERLLTPRGLRTLAPDDPKFIGRFGGPQSERDGAYHQGMVWPFLLGPFISALVRLRGERGRAEALRLVVEFEPHLAEAGVGTISEIFDPFPPYTPRGCIAQAWSVGELLRVMSEDLGIAARRRPPISEKSVRCD